MSTSHSASYEIVAQASGTWSANLKPDGELTLEQVVEIIQKFAMDNRFLIRAYLTLSETVVTQLPLARDPSRRFDPTAPLIESCNTAASCFTALGWKPTANAQCSHLPCLASCLPLPSSAFLCLASVTNQVCLPLPCLAHWSALPWPMGGKARQGRGKIRWEWWALLVDSLKTSEIIRLLFGDIPMIS
jgi:hypothetical protein